MHTRNVKTWPGCGRGGSLWSAMYIGNSTSAAVPPSGMFSAVGLGSYVAVVSSKSDGICTWHDLHLKRKAQRVHEL